MECARCGKPLVKPTEHPCNWCEAALCDECGKNPGHCAKPECVESERDFQWDERHYEFYDDE
jgi:hypothetical protein